MPYLRFTIVTFPVVIGSAFLLLEKAIQSPSKRSAREQRWYIWVNRGGITLFLLLIVCLRYGEVQRGMRNVVSDPGSRTTAVVARMLSHILAPDAVIFSQRPFFCYLGTRERFRLYDLRVFQGPLGSSVRRQPKRTERLRAFYDSLDEAGLQRAKRALVRNFLQRSRQVVFLIPHDALAKEQKQLGREFQFTPIKKWRPPPAAAAWGLYEVSPSKTPREKTIPSQAR